MARQEGTPNRPKRLMVLRLEEKFGKGFNVIMQMANNAKNIQMCADIATQEAAEEARIDIDGETQQEKKARVKVKLGDVRSTAMDAIMAWDKIAQYTEPKLKQIEVKDTTNDKQSKEGWTVTYVNPVGVELKQGEVTVDQLNAAREGKTKQKHT